MDERSDADKMEELMLPGFRFHPTDEELVGFYLKRKIQQRPLSIELIKQLDIYKYDPWDLPKLATTGEKEWYFYCPRDRKYRNSARPNRVTGAGFWKATGTDRPIYSSEGTSKCIGLKKSLVFYKGRAAKGFKTDWMMHEFRLPSLTDSASQKRFVDKSIPPTDLWAICRIFKKTNSSVQRAISQSWASPLFETPTASYVVPTATERPSSDDMSSFTTTQFSCGSDLQRSSSITSFAHLDFPPTYKPISNHHELVLDLPASHTFTLSDQIPSINQPTKSCTVDASSILLNMSSSVFGDFGKASESVDFNGLQEQCTAAGFTITTATLLPDGITERDCSNGEDQITAATLIKGPDVAAHFHDDQWGSTVRSAGFPFTATLASTSPSTSLPHDAWKSSHLMWDSSPCPSEMSTTAYSTNKCYT